MSGPPDGDSFGPYRINPSFDEFPEEARIVGKLLASFDEIEHLICRNSAHACDLTYEVLKALYRLRSTSSRMDAADALAAPRFKQWELHEEYEVARGMALACLKIRNQFAHCMWGSDDDHSAGLFFTDPQASAETLEEFDYLWSHVDVPLLKSHEAYFALTLEWLQFLGRELFRRRHSLVLRTWPVPPRKERPPLHNPPEKHVPPWITEDQKDRHRARAVAAKGGAPTPTQGQQALDKARAEKRAKREANRDRAAAEHSSRVPES